MSMIFNFDNYMRNCNLDVTFQDEGQNETIMYHL